MSSHPLAVTPRHPGSCDPPNEASRICLSCARWKAHAASWRNCLSMRP